MNIPRFGRHDRKNNPPADPAADDILSDRFDPDYMFEDLVDEEEGALFDENGIAVPAEIDAGRSARPDGLTSPTGKTGMSARLAEAAREAIAESADDVLRRFLSGAVIGVIDTAVADVVAAIPEMPEPEAVGVAVREAMADTVASFPEVADFSARMDEALADQAEYVTSQLFQFAEALPPMVEPAELDAAREALSVQMSTVVDDACDRLARQVETDFVERVTARIDSAAEEAVRAMSADFGRTLASELDAREASAPPVVSLGEFTGAVEVVVSDLLGSLPAPATPDDVSAVAALVEESLTAKLSGLPRPASPADLEAVVATVTEALRRLPTPSSPEDVSAAVGALTDTLTGSLERLPRPVTPDELSAAMSALTELVESRPVLTADQIADVSRSVVAPLVESIPAPLVPPTVDELAAAVPAGLSRDDVVAAVSDVLGSRPVPPTRDDLDRVVEQVVGAVDGLADRFPSSVTLNEMQDALAGLPVPATSSEVDAVASLLVGLFDAQERPATPAQVADEVMIRLARRPLAATPEDVQSLSDRLVSLLSSRPVAPTVEEIVAELPVGVTVEQIENVVRSLLGHAPKAASSGLVTAGFEDVEQRLSELATQLDRIGDRVVGDDDVRRVLGAIAAEAERSDSNLVDAVEAIERRIEAESERLSKLSGSPVTVEEIGRAVDEVLAVRLGEQPKAATVADLAEAVDRVLADVPVPPSAEDISRQIVSDLSSTITSAVSESTRSIVSTVTAHIDRRTGDKPGALTREDVHGAVSAAVAEHLGPDIVGKFESRLKLALTGIEDQVERLHSRPSPITSKDLRSVLTDALVSGPQGVSSAREVVDVGEVPDVEVEVGKPRSGWLSRGSQ